MSEDEAIPTPGFAHPPYHVDEFPIGACVCNASGFNCLSFPSQPGAKFTSLERARTIRSAWNESAGMANHPEIELAERAAAVANAKRPRYRSAFLENLRARDGSTAAQTGDAA